MNVQWFAFGLMSLMLVIAAVNDCRRGIVPNRLTYPAIVGGLLLWTIAQGWSGLGDSSLALMAGLIPTALIFFGGALGGGDVKVMAAVGALSASWQVVLGTAVYGLLLAMLMAISIIIQKKLLRQTMVHLLNALLRLASKRRPDLPEDGVKLPFSLALAVGGVLAGIEHLLKVELPWSAWVC